MIEYKSLTKDNKEFEEFFNFKIANLSLGSQKSKTTTLNEFLTILNNKSVKKMDKKDILIYLDDKDFLKLKNSSKNLKIVHIKTLLRYFERDDLIELFPKYNVKQKELDKNSLITREDLDKLLKSCINIKEKVMIMLLYESAIRRDEFLNIRKKNIEFYDNYLNLYIEKSKTKGRNIPLVESMSYLKEFFNDFEFKNEELLFEYSENYLNQLITKINNRCKRKFKEYNKEINPHLFRHSRLTELASNNKLNEPQLRKFAGWSKRSDMPSIYFHLDDSNLRNELIELNGKEIEKTEIKTFESIRCPNCSEINNKFNDVCWKCGKVLNENLIGKVFNYQEEIQKLNGKIESITKLLDEYKQKEKSEFYDTLVMLMSNENQIDVLNRKYEEDSSIDIDLELKAALFLKSLKTYLKN